MKKDHLHQRYIMPAEWSTHAATLIIWPHNLNTWPNQRLKAVEEVYHSIILTLLKYEPILLFVNDDKIKKRALKNLGDVQSRQFPLQIKKTPVNDVWARDSGPIFVRENDKYVITDWEFNSWGRKYSPWDDDNLLPNKISEMFSIPSLKTGFVLEGGSIDTNGRGLFLTTESVLLNPNRNPGVSKVDIESHLQHYLGAKKIIWLKEGLEGDDTDGHVDDLTRFVSENTVVTTISDDPNNPNYDILLENLNILKNSSGIHGEKLNIIELPLPDTKIDDPTVDGSEHVPCSYANFYIANNVILLPMYNEQTDHEMLDLFSKLFPGRTIEGISCKNLVWGQGSIHCITQQLYGLEI